MKTGVVIPVLNQLSWTSCCISRLRERTSNYILIVVDNNSNDGTKEYLHSLSIEMDNIIIITNEKNLGFGPANNQAFRLIQSQLEDIDYICMLNNDTMVGTGWLQAMIDTLEKNREIGAMNPLSNNFGLEIPIEVSIDDYNVYLQNLPTNIDYVETDTLIGFCYLFRREFLETVGFLDEQFEYGNFEETDYCLRIKEKGFKLAISYRSYVWHKMFQTFQNELPISYDEIFLKNKERFERKWKIKKDN